MTLPRERWPKHCIDKYESPVVPLILALSGHPDAGGCWKQACDKAVKECGWVGLEDAGWEVLLLAS